MIEKMKGCGRALCDKDIDGIEAHIGIHLPEEYRAFLLRYNGGRPTPRAFPIEGLANNPFGVILDFFGIDDTVESCNLDWNVETMNGRLPANLLPIACDDGGDLICLSLFGEDADSVLFWDRHKEKGAPSYENVFKIASSFTEFIDGVRELPDGPQAS